MRQIFQAFFQRSDVNLFSSKLFRIICRSFVPSSGNNSRLVRYLKCNLSFEVPKLVSAETPEIEILFVAAGKDSKLLPYAITGAIGTTDNSKVLSITVICPKADLITMRQSIQFIDFPVLITSEDEIIEDSFIESLKDLYGSRYGWVLQQFLKVMFVKNSKADGVLVIDSDTILLKSRLWLDTHRTQVLMPTWERHDPYFDFLKANKFNVRHDSFSHVSHHMILQPDILREMLSEYGLHNPDAFIKAFLKSPIHENSPFSIDYEMYAQYMLAKYPKLVRYEKWANRSVRNLLPEEIQRQLNVWKTNYNSVSAHSYNQS
jgi:hypothetical protein